MHTTFTSCLAQPALCETGIPVLNPAAPTFVSLFDTDLCPCDWDLDEHCADCVAGYALYSETSATSDLECYGCGDPYPASDESFCPPCSAALCA